MRVDRDLDRVLALRLLQESPIAELALLALAAMAVGFLSHVVPLPFLAAWGLSLIAATLGREQWRRRGLSGRSSTPQIFRGLRFWVALSGSIWGLGAGLLAVHVPFPIVALSAIVLGGLVAGGLVTLMPDPVAFRILVGSVLLPLAVGTLLGGLARERVAAAALLAVFGGFEVAVHERAYLDLVDHETTKALALRQRHELEESLKRVKLLSGLLPICAGCKKIRDGNDVWHPVEAYVKDHSEARFSHGLCPDCLKEFEQGAR